MKCLREDQSSGNAARGDIRTEIKNEETGNWDEVLASESKLHFAPATYDDPTGIDNNSAGYSKVPFDSCNLPSHCVIKDLWFGEINSVPFCPGEASIKGRQV